MVDPILSSVGRIGPPSGAPPASAPSSGVGGGSDFASIMRDQLGRVSSMQHEADEKVQALVSGQSDSLSEVFVAARKAEVAFTLLMEVRNKLVEAYQELQNMRV